MRLEGRASPVFYLYFVFPVVHMHIKGYSSRAQLVCISNLGYIFQRFIHQIVQ
jgi:hypothetical protein